MPILLSPEDIKKLERTRRPKRVTPVRSPARAERLMARNIEEMWRSSILPTLDRIKAAIERNASADEIGQILQNELANTTRQWDISAQNLLDTWRLMVDRGVKEKMNFALSKALGVDIAAIYDDPTVTEALVFGSMEAADLIKSMPQNQLGLVQKAVLDNFKGIPLPENRSLLEQIDFLSGKMNFKRRAKLIARDQTNKLVSVLDQARQQMIGVEKYTWRTSKDRRVVGNPSGLYPVGSKAHGNHWIMEGKMCRWDDATVYSSDGGKTWKKRTGDMPKTHPAYDIQCRCYAEPVLEIERILEFARAA